EPGWSQWVSRQADRLFRVGRGDREPPPAGSGDNFPAPLQAQQLVDLILLQPADTRFPSGSERWVDAADPARLFHLRRDEAGDIAFPILAMTRGNKVSERLFEHFGGAEIADLWLPYFCLSANLTTGAYHMHKRGLVWKALRASVALPGVMPPATDGDNVLVDGA